MPRFPLRTIILMFLTLAAFGWFYWNTHKTPPRPPPRPPERRMPAGVQDVQVVPPPLERDH